MTFIEFIRKVCELAAQHPRPVLAVDIEPAKDGIRLSFRYKE